ncbi:MAG TPA: glycosyltransferase, partial [Stellaceae bacterium]|nr:glycosyltransferase [Stellaceae bacterium]
PELYLFTDADIVHPPDNLRALVARLLNGELDLVSLMVRLRAESGAERFLIPAFVFFFAMLYPFAWSSDRRRASAAAAGGCMLLRAAAYRRIGGYEALKGALIDDCALAKEVKRGGAIWLGLSLETKSLRPYPGIADIWRMVARTAYTQLSCSPLRLLGAVIGLVITYLVPPLLVFARGPSAWIAGAAWAAMTLAFLPMIRFYRLSPLWAPLLPATALVYVAATIDSARRHWRGTGGQWKGRVAGQKAP